MPKLLGTALGIPVQWSHTWIVGGAIGVPSGQTNFIPPVSIPVKAGTVANLARVRYRVNNGAAGITVSFKLQVNGADVTGYGTTAAPLVTATATTWAETDPTDVALADNDSVAVVVTAIAGAPENLSVSAILESAI